MRRRKSSSDQVGPRTPHHDRGRDLSILQWLRPSPNRLRRRFRRPNANTLRSKKILGQMENLEPEDEQWEMKLQELQQDVEHHLQEEEEEMFPEARKVLSAGRAESARPRGERMAVRKHELQKTMGIENEASEPSRSVACEVIRLRATSNFRPAALLQRRPIYSCQRNLPRLLLLNG